MLALVAAGSILVAVTAAPLPDSLAKRHIVRQFPPIEVQGGRFSDPGSAETVHSIPQASLARLPVDDLRGAIALQPGVVAIGEDLHVRGGRAGEMALSLLGLPLNDPRTGVPLELPLFAVRSVDLMTGTMDADRAGSLAGDLEVHTEVPASRLRPRLRYATDGESERNVDVAHAAFSMPLARTGAGLALAAEARYDDLGLPNLRSSRNSTFMGYAYGWRNDNHVSAWGKLAPVDRPQRASLELIVNRVVRAPYNPMFTYDGWVTVDRPWPGVPSGNHWYSLTPEPLDATSIRYRAADHVAMTEERRFALVGSLSRGTTIPVRLTAGWLRTHTQTSVGLRPGVSSIPEPARAAFGPYNVPGTDPFHVLFGDEPYSLEATADRLMARADAVTAPFHNQLLRLGAGADHERVKFAERDEAGPVTDGVSPLRAYRNTAPTVFAFAQHRFEFAGLLLNDGLRLQRYSAGSANPGAPALWTWSPRVGVAYPVTVRDAFSFSYARIAQAPSRGLLYDSGTRSYDRHPQGNPGLEPSEAIAWQAALKHILDAAWTMQASVFERDVWGEPGARNSPRLGGFFTLQYENADEAHATGFEFELTHTSPGGSRVRAGYTFLNAWGSMSNPDGIAFGQLTGERPLPTGTHPLDWDLRHVAVFEASLRPLPDCSFDWVTRVASGRPWTPLHRIPGLSDEWPPVYQDQSLINSRRLPWTEVTNLSLKVAPRKWQGRYVGVRVTNLFDQRGADLVTLSGYPNSTINTQYDEYTAYRTETGKGGGAYWSGDGAHGPSWHPVNDPRLEQQRRSVRFELGLLN